MNPRNIELAVWLSVEVSEAALSASRRNAYDEHSPASREDLCRSGTNHHPNFYLHVKQRYWHDSESTRKSLYPW